MDTFEFSQFGIKGVFRPKDREYLVRDGEYVRLPTNEVFLVKTDDLSLERADDTCLPDGAVVVDLVREK